jgi:hypothetical protein
MGRLMSLFSDGPTRERSLARRRRPGVVDRALDDGLQDLKAEVERR